MKLTRRFNVYVKSFVKNATLDFSISFSFFLFLFLYHGISSFVYLTASFLNNFFLSVQQASLRSYVTNYSLCVIYLS